MVLKQCAQVTTILRRADLVEGLDVLLREHLEEELVAGAARRVAGAGLAVTEHREADAGGVEQLGHGARRLLGAVLVGAGAADPEEVVDLVQGLDVDADLLDLEGQVLGPVHPQARRETPRVGVLLEVLEQAVELGGEGRLDEVLVAAQVDDGVDVLDVDGALLDARAARRARPEDVVVDDGVRPVRVVGRERVADVVAGRADELLGGHGALRRVAEAVGLLDATGADLLGGEQPR